MRLITGAAGFIGEFVVRETYKENPMENVRFFVRSSTNRKFLMKFPAEFFLGDLKNINSVKKAMEGVTEVLHLAGIRYSPNIIKAAKEAGVKKVILLHTTQMFSKHLKEAKKYKKIESIISSEPVDYTILRPTMVYGSRKNRNIHKIVLFINKHSFYPFIGSDKCLIQPIYAGDVAKACLDVLKTNKTVRKAYNIAGKNYLTWRKVISIIAKSLGVKVRTFRIPLWFGIFALSAYKLVSNNPKLTVKNILRFNENKNFNISLAKKDFGFDPISFEEGIKLEIKEKGDLL